MLSETGLRLFEVHLEVTDAENRHWSPIGRWLRVGVKLIPLLHEGSPAVDRTPRVRLDCGLGRPHLGSGRQAFFE